MIRYPVDLNVQGAGFSLHRCRQVGNLTKLGLSSCSVHDS